MSTQVEQRRVKGGVAFHGFTPLTANFTMVPNEVWDLKLPGLTGELRWTLAVIARESIGTAYLRGGSPYDLQEIPYSRFQDLLDLRSISAVKARLARLEELGLVQIQAGEVTRLGTRPNRYRLAWHGDGRILPRTFKKVSEWRARENQRKRPAGQKVEVLSASGEGGYSPTHTPHVRERTPHPAHTPGGMRLDQHPSKEEFSLLTEKELPPVGQSVGNNPTDRPTALEIPEALNPWVKGSAHLEPWPQQIIESLGALLDPPQLARIEAEAVWTPEGVWAIYQAVKLATRLRNQPGTLWGALREVAKGEAWLRKVAPILREAGWQELPEDGTPGESVSRRRLGEQLLKLGLARMPLGVAEVGLRLEIMAQAKEEDRRSEALLASMLDDAPEEELEEDDSPSAPPSTQSQPVPTRFENLPHLTRSRLAFLLHAFEKATDTRRLATASAAERETLQGARDEAWKPLEAALSILGPLHLPEATGAPGRAVWVPGDPWLTHFTWRLRTGLAPELALVGRL